MSMQPDLHTHTTASDGTLSPCELVARAAAAGVRVLALTDHDTTAGVPEAQGAAIRQGLILIPGVEISATWSGRTVHIVGLGVDPTDPTLSEGLERLLAYRAWRAEEIARRLAKSGIDDALEGARSMSEGTLIGRTHFARFLVNRGYAGSVREVFRHYLVKGKPGHVPGEWASLQEAIGWIGAAGGQAVIAHPARYGLTRSAMLRLIGEHKEAGGAGIEVISGSHSRDDAFVFARYANESGLLASAGSDYHGPDGPYVELGRLATLPKGCVPIWADWKAIRLPRTESA